MEKYQACNRKMQIYKSGKPLLWGDEFNKVNMNKKGVYSMQKWVAVQRTLIEFQGIDAGYCIDRPKTIPCGSLKSSESIIGPRWWVYLND